LGDEPGLGKTVQAIVAAREAGVKNILVTCPASVRESWTEHLKFWMQGYDVKWTIHSYPMVVRLGTTIPKDFDLIILDEFHYLKSRHSKRTSHVLQTDGIVYHGTKYRWGLSGTFVPNGRPAELYPILKTLCPAFRGISWDHYAIRFCGGYYNGWEWRADGATHIEEFNERIKGFLLRRTKSEVYPGRVEPLVTVVPLHLGEKFLAPIYEEERKIGARTRPISTTYHRANTQLGDVATLLRVIGVQKTYRALGFILDQLMKAPKIVVFYHHVEVGDRLFSEVDARGIFKPLRFHGGMSDRDKEAVKKRFKKEEHRILFAQDQAAQTGINGLQEICSMAIDVEPSWSPGDTEQRIARLDRIGQSGEIVNYYLLYAAGTLDEAKISVQARKQRSMVSITGDHDLAKYL
jgi:SNF2 family DNA or RNA helicase